MRYTKQDLEGAVEYLKRLRPGRAFYIDWSYGEPALFERDLQGGHRNILGRRGTKRETAREIWAYAKGLED